MDQNQQTEEQEIDLLELAQKLWRRRKSGGLQHPEGICCDGDPFAGVRGIIRQQPGRYRLNDGRELRQR